MIVKITKTVILLNLNYSISLVKNGLFYFYTIIFLWYISFTYFKD